MNKREKAIYELWEFCFATIKCEYCKNEINGNDTDEVAQAAYELGWKVTRSGRVRCDECVAKGRRK